MKNIARFFGVCSVMVVTSCTAVTPPGVQYPAYKTTEGCVQSTLHDTLGVLDDEAQDGAQRFFAVTYFSAPDHDEQGNVSATVILDASRTVTFMEIQLNRRDPDGTGMDAINTATLDYGNGLSGVFSSSETSTPYPRELAETILTTLDNNLRDCNRNVLALTPDRP